MQVVIVLSNDAARLRLDLPPGASDEQLREAQEELGLPLEPMHPGVTDPGLRAYLTAEVPDEDTAQRVMTRLQRVTSVEAAYIKPAAEPP